MKKPLPKKSKLFKHKMRTYKSIVRDLKVNGPLQSVGKYKLDARGIPVVPYPPDATIATTPENENEVRVKEGNELLRKKFLEMVNARVGAASDFMDRCDSENEDAKRYLSGVVAGIIICREIADMTLTQVQNFPKRPSGNLFMAGELINPGDLVTWDATTGTIKKACLEDRDPKTLADCKKRFPH
jgi:hypothetical protein